MKIAVLTVFFLLAGCATPLAPVVVSRGHGLAVVSVQPPEVVAVACLNPKALACAASRPDGVTFFSVLPPAWWIDQANLVTIVTVVTHEVCHALADWRGITPDPCHDEDGGVLR